MKQPLWVSVHGGHSGQFCCHATDTLDAVVQAYADRGFSWVGITEHAPPASDAFRYPDDVAAGLTAASMHRRFSEYIETCRRCQRRFADRITVYVGFESETYTGAIPFAQTLRETFRPDYVVGSIHHVDDMPFDTSPSDYRSAADAQGGVASLYLKYFDQQLEMIDALVPEVVGHFDLIRIFDADYPRRMGLPAVQARIRRNLERIRELGLILDFNLAALSKGASEPYLAAPILVQARDLGIAVVPGDDAHGVDTVGRHMTEGIKRLARLGFDTDWPVPIRRHRLRPRP
jgi:histidinol-phosphatase (PHP family)